jgi:hypothetical protein
LGSGELVKKLNCTNIVGEALNTNTLLICQLQCHKDAFLQIQSLLSPSFSEFSSYMTTLNSCLAECNTTHIRKDTGEGVTVEHTSTINEEQQ